MGILDDAIREHLELKRKHGVAEEEVERQEEEALGPARRDVAQQPKMAKLPADAVDDTSLFDGDHGDAPAAEAPVAADDETAIAEPPAIRGAVVRPSAAASRSRLGGRGAPRRRSRSVASRLGGPEPARPRQQPTGAEPPPAEPEPTAAEAPPEPDPHEALGDTEPHGFPALDEEDEDDVHEDAPRAAPEDDDSEEDDPAAEADDDELDVLEDTPDFLQETPEHDRLWFEQKPPRDFDFD